MKLILMFPNRGKPPADQPGYDRDPGNPFVFRLKWISCTARQDAKLCKGCPQSIILHQCNFYNKEVDQNVCNQCGGIEAATERQLRNESAIRLRTERLYEKSIESRLPDMSTSSIRDTESDSASGVSEDQINVVV